MISSTYKIVQKFQLSDDERKAVVYCNLRPIADEATWAVLQSFGAVRPAGECEIVSILWENEHCIVTWKCLS